jgi:hypothetical protein
LLMCSTNTWCKHTATMTWSVNDRKCSCALFATLKLQFDAVCAAFNAATSSQVTSGLSRSNSRIQVQKRPFHCEQFQQNHVRTSRRADVEKVAIRVRANRPWSSTAAWEFERKTRNCRPRTSSSFECINN